MYRRVPQLPVPDLATAGAYPPGDEARDGSPYAEPHLVSTGTVQHWRHTSHRRYNVDHLGQPVTGTSSRAGCTASVGTGVAEDSGGLARTVTAAPTAVLKVAVSVTATPRM